jgi:hypothetical protein
MITDLERKFLEQLLKGEISKEDNPKRYSAMMLRIRKEIDKNIVNLMWLIDNYPRIFTDEEAEIDNPQLERYRRFRALAYIITKIDPSIELEKLSLPDFLKKLSQMYPKYYFQIMRKENESKSS